MFLQLGRLMWLAAVLVCMFALSIWAQEPRPVADYFDAKGVRIHYYVLGEGQPVVLIHGLGSSAAMNWQLPGITAMLARRHRVIALDLPGHGGSDKPRSEEAYGLRMVDDVILLMDHLKIQKAQIVGYSLGGIIALRLIADHPDRVTAGALGGMGWLRQGSPLQHVWENMGGRDGGLIPPACPRSVGALALTEESIKSIKVPMEMLVGDRDPVRRLYVVPLQRERPDWPVVVVNDAGHIECVTRQQFKDELVKWVDKNTSGATTRPATTAPSR